MNQIQITDLYQASYLLLSGCELTGVACIPTGGALTCRLSFEGERLASLSQDWWDKKAVVNLWAFRSAYNQVNSYVHQAKKNYSLLQQRREVQR